MYCDIPDFGRCCFCLPLRRGVLLFGYLNVLFCAFMIGVYSYHINNGGVDFLTMMYKGVVVSDSMPGFVLTVYCLEVIFNCILVYGAHEKKLLPIKLFYYFAVTTILAALVMEIVEISRERFYFEMLVLTFFGLIIQLYLIFLVRSLLKKLEMGSSNAYDNQLHTIVVGEPVTNGVYNNTTVPPENKE